MKHKNSNPSEDNALTLAAELQMDISIGPDKVKVTTVALALADVWIEEPVIDGDKEGATRRAILRCAAA